MFTQIWFWLYILSEFIANTAPKTSKLGGVLNFLSMIAKFVFVILVFFFAPFWWWGLVLIALFFLVIILTPRVNPEKMSPAGLVYSGIVSHINPIIVFFIYILFFRG